MKKIFTNNIILFFIFIIFYIYLISNYWELFKLPFSNNNQTIGFLTINNINPLNDTLRFFLFVGPPFLFIFLFLKKNFKSNFVGIKSFFKTEDNYIKNLNFKNFYIINIFFLIFIVLEFLSIDFSQINTIDTLHDGDYLTPLLNYQNFEGFWTSSFTVHGGRELFIPIIASKIFGTNNFGAIKFLYLFLIFLVKFFSILISYKFINLTRLEIGFKLIIYVISTFFLLSLSSYTKIGILNIRDLFVLISFLFLFQIFLKKNNIVLSFFFASSIILALFFHYDTGLYLFFLFICIIIFFLFKKKFYDVFLLSFSIFINFFLFFIFLEKNEILSFIQQIQYAVTNIDKVHGLEYPKPFFSIGEIKDGSRGTKLLIFFLSLGFFVNFSIFLENKYLVIKEKILIIFIYLYSLISFKNALGRSDAPHMMVSSDWVSILLYYYLIFSLFFFISSKIKSIDKNKILRVLFLLLFLINFFKFGDLKFLNFDKNLKYFINKPLHAYLNNETNDALAKLSEIFENDDCINNFTTNLSLPYMLNKPTCHLYFSSWLISGNDTEEKYISLLKKNNSNIIYDAPSLIIDGIPTSKRLKKVDKYIKENYYETLNYKNYIIYKKKGF